MGWTENRGCFVSNAKGSVLAVPFRGTHVAVVGKSDCHSGYARVSVLNAKKDTVYSSLVDFIANIQKRQSVL